MMWAWKEARTEADENCVHKLNLKERKYSGNVDIDWKAISTCIWSE